MELGRQWMCLVGRMRLRGDTLLGCDARTQAFLESYGIDTDVTGSERMIILNRSQVNIEL
jgi:hypothetical protein